MASYLNKPGGNNIFGSSANFAEAVTTKATQIAPGGQWILYLLVILFIVLVIAILRGTKIDLSWLDPRPRRWKVLARASHFWIPSGIYTNLIVPAHKAVPDMSDLNYSMTIEYVLYDSRNYNTTEGPYRHIMHRGSNELASVSVAGMAVSGCAANQSGDLPPFGLPKRLNPGIFLDPNTNDILVFVDTTNGSDTYRESLRVSDIPLDTPARLCVVMNGQVLEVYLNCRLEATKILRGQPKHVENEWYGIAGTASAQAQVQNLYVWNESLGIEDMLSLCPGPPVFKNKRPICSNADAPVAPATTTTTKVDLGLGASLKAVCPN